MATDLHFYRHLVEALTQGPVVIATVIQTNGSVPREVGAKMLIRAHGPTWGTIGGGAGEAKVLRQARTVLTTGENQQVIIDLTGSPQREIQGICGGQMRVWLARWQGNEAIALAHTLEQQLAQGKAINLVIPLGQQQLPYVESSPAGLSRPSDEPDVPRLRILLQPPPTLLIVGAGHCGIQLAEVADRIGFQVVVQDDRKDWAHPQNFPKASRVLNQSIDVVVEELADYSQLYAALVTRGFDYDLPALRALLKRALPCRYLGMIGSRKRVRKALNAIQAEPTLRERSRSIYAPIGLDIGALTPEEIAVSICAELILVRRGGTGKPLSTLL
jgi:xanthine dehydrogenase accessory factor